jgi:predicted TIM-barrel fold metal-dependent hydrolase
LLVIDVHPHVISSDTQRFPRAPLGGHQSDWSRERPVSYERLIAAQDLAGVAKAALVQASTCYGHDNSYVADAVAAHSERFAGVFSCDILLPDAIATMTHWMQRGLTGLRLFTTGSTMPGQQNWLDDPRTYPSWRHAEEKGLPVCLQMTAKGIPQLITILHQFPKLHVILDHLARPTQEDGPPYKKAAPLWGLAKFPNVFLKVTERNLIGARSGKATPETFFGKAVAQFGADRIAWGSNYPASERSLPDLVALAKDTLAFLSKHDREWIFAGTAQRLYPSLANGMLQ